jgi:hypothetical protein
VAATVRAAGGELEVTDEPTVLIDAVRALPTTRYATPAPR